MPQERFSRGGRYSGIPPFRPRVSSKAFSRFDVIGEFRAVEDGVDAAVPVDAKKRAHKGLGKLHNPQFSTAPTPLLFFFTRRKGTTKNAASVPI
jgi:hypothetical protein